MVRAARSRRGLGDGQRDQAGLGRRGLVGGGRRRGLGVGAGAELGGGDGADGEGGHDQHGVAEDRGVEAGLALVETEVVLAELEVSPRPATSAPLRGSAGSYVSELALGEVAVVEGQLAGAPGAGGRAGSAAAVAVAICAHAYHRWPLDPAPAERTSH